MRDFLMNNGLSMMWALGIAEAVLGVLCLKGRSRQLCIMCAVMSFGLTVDAFIQAAGVLMGEGAALQAISQIRYILHGILLPLLIPMAFYAYGIRRKAAKIILWAVTGAIMVMGIAMGLMVKTEPVSMAGVLRYAQAGDSPAFARMMNRILSFGGVIPLMLAGLAHLIRHKRVWPLLSGVSMFAFAALAPATHNMDLNFVLTMVGEALMMMFFWLQVRQKKA